MRLSREEVNKIKAWMEQHEYDYVEISPNDPSNVRGYKMDLLKLRERKKED